MLHHMVTILVCYGGHFESKMAAKIQKSSDLVKIWFPSRSWSCELIIVIVFGIGSHWVGWCPLLLCNGNSSSYYYFSTRFCPLDFSEMPSSNLWNLVGISYAMWSCAVKSSFFFKFLPLPWKRPKCKQIEKHKNDHSGLLAKQKFMKLDRNNIHI